MRRWLALGLIALHGSLASADEERAGDWRGFFAAEVRTFGESPLFPEQEDGVGGSLVMEPEYYRELSRDGESVTFKPFLRLDSLDSERTHLDLRELYWRKAARRWELVAGIHKVFWGVTESQHLVDIVNQTDGVENPDGEDKLGQPMVKLSLVRPIGIFEFYVLPGFRERTFPGVEGRLRTALPIDTDRPLYESSDEERHIDFAVRWSHAVGPFDLGLSHFHGTGREPRFVVLRGEDSLRPLYEQIDQTGLDLQATLGNWLLKLEAIHRESEAEEFEAATTGFEYTFWGIGGTRADLGAVVEYLWDDRDELATTPFEDDLFVGTRLAFNDVQSSEILAGAILDNDDSAAFYLVEASRRFGSNWVLEAEVRVFSGLEPTDPFADLRSDDYFQISLQRHF